MVGHAFVATMRLHAVYDIKKRITRTAADRNIDLFFRLASVKCIAPQFKMIVERVKTHRSFILNYYDAVALLGPDYSPSTGPTERRNGSIKGAWSASRGIRDHRVFSMRALYEPYRLDVDIAICAEKGCTTVDGPFGAATAARKARVMMPLHTHRCAAHP